MLRISFPDFSTRPEHIRKMVESNPLNAVRMMAHATPGVFEGFYRFGSSFYSGSPLAADHREIGILCAGYVAKATYETHHHESVIKSIGVTDAQIAAIKAGGKHPGILNDAQQAVLDFAYDFVVNARPSDATLAAVRKHLSDQQLMDLMFVTGLYMTISRIVATTGIPLEDTLVDAKKMEELSKAPSAQ